jgi:potassium-transporting ATPase KdpC subunit
VISSIVRSIAAVAVLILAFGFAYPLLITGIGQVAFGDKADGSLITRSGQVIGSKLAAQEFTKPEYFHSRLSATAPAYNAAGTTFSNLGPTSPELRKQVEDQIVAIMKLEGPYNPGLAAGAIPVDAVTTSGSGIDPDISPAYADLQANRIAQVRSIPLETVKRLISDNTHGRSIGLLGEPGVNVLQLNLDLDQLGGQS